MGSPAHVSSQETEAEFLEALRSRYESQGFSFVVHPQPTALPDFLASYVPDALARKQGQNIAIEVKQQQSSSTQRRIREIRQMFEGRPDWQFQVFYIGSTPLQSIVIPSATPADIQKEMDGVRQLSAEGHRRAAFIIAWSLLEAALKSLDDNEPSTPRTPGTVVQTLAMNGFISAEMEQRVRALIQLRNRIVHGDVGAQPTEQEVALVLQAIEDALTVETE